MREGELHQVTLDLGKSFCRRKTSFLPTTHPPNRSKYDRCLVVSRFESTYLKSSPLVNDLDHGNISLVLNLCPVSFRSSWPELSRGLSLSFINSNIAIMLYGGSLGLSDLPKSRIARSLTQHAEYATSDVRRNHRTVQGVLMSFYNSRKSLLRHLPTKNFSLHRTP